ncbi:hypothetical protein R3P38DRAFT_963160 [Favolaschia claudopus]|uniref:Uncharacterized protein n=1 Tax=Favolaschia claudopus TaxID=2862362 RepID=A0AAW0E2P8_9AGAR
MSRHRFPPHSTSYHITAISAAPASLLALMLHAQSPIASLRRDYSFNLIIPPAYMYLAGVPLRLWKPSALLCVGTSRIFVLRFSRSTVFFLSLCRSPFSLLSSPLHLHSLISFRPTPLVIHSAPGFPPSAELLCTSDEGTTTAIQEIARHLFRLRLDWGESSLTRCRTWFLYTRWLGMVVGERPADIVHVGVENLSRYFSLASSHDSRMNECIHRLVNYPKNVPYCNHNSFQYTYI